MSKTQSFIHSFIQCQALFWALGIEEVTKTKKEPLCPGKKEEVRVSTHIGKQGKGFQN